MTWLSLRSGIASIGVVSSAQYPQAPTSTNRPSTRKRFRSDASISQLTISPPCETLVVRQSARIVRSAAGRRETDACRESTLSTRTDYELRGVESGSGRRVGERERDARKIFRRARRHDRDRREDHVADRRARRETGRGAARAFAHRAHGHAVVRRHGQRCGEHPHHDGDHRDGGTARSHDARTITRGVRTTGIMDTLGIGLVLVGLASAAAPAGAQQTGTAAEIPHVHELAVDRRAPHIVRSPPALTVVPTRPGSRWRRDHTSASAPPPPPPTTSAPPTAGA